MVGDRAARRLDRRADLARDLEAGGGLARNDARVVVWRDEGELAARLLREALGLLLRLQQRLAVDVHLGANALDRLDAHSGRALRHHDDWRVQPKALRRNCQRMALAADLSSQQCTRAVA
eukprot:3885936-Pleurochrysis_carterae.AAC.3